MLWLPGRHIDRQGHKMVALDGHPEMATFKIDHFVPFFSATLAKKIVTAERLMGCEHPV